MSFEEMKQRILNEIENKKDEEIKDIYDGIEYGERSSEIFVEFMKSIIAGKESSEATDCFWGIMSGISARRNESNHLQPIDHLFRMAVENYVGVKNGK